MEQNDMDLASLANYFSKLKKTITNQATFSFAGNQYVKKIKIDDLICCIDASFPENYRNMIRKGKLITFTSGKYYNNLLMELKGRNSILFRDCYVISYAQVETLITGILNTIKNDLKKIN